MGSRAGKKNTVGHNTKLNIETVFDLLGGTQGLYTWAQDNPGAFYLGLYSKLLPKNIEAKVNVQTLEDLVAASATETDLVIEGTNIISIESRSDKQE